MLQEFLLARALARGYIAYSKKSAPDLLDVIAACYQFAENPDREAQICLLITALCTDLRNYISLPLNFRLIQLGIVARVFFTQHFSGSRGLTAPFAWYIPVMLFLSEEPTSLEAEQETPVVKPASVETEFSDLPNLEDIETAELLQLLHLVKPKLEAPSPVLELARIAPEPEPRVVPENSTLLEFSL